MSAGTSREKLQQMVKECLPIAEESQSQYIVRIRSKMKNKYKSRIRNYATAWFRKIVGDAYENWVDSRKVNASFPKYFSFVRHHQMNHFLRTRKLVPIQNRTTS